MLLCFITLAVEQIIQKLDVRWVELKG